jgi:glycosyltransferase involved in cell wall biosynthesis
LKFRLPVQARDSNLIVYVGRLVEKKGGPYLIRAAALASQKHPALHLVIIGEGPLREEMEGLAKELKVNCTFLGRLLDPEPGNTVLDWLARARMFCMPSITASDGNTEGQPAVFVEAHALGTPAVSFRSAGIGEAVLDGETGYLVPEKDVPALAEKIVTLLTDDEIWSRFSQRARTWVWERFDRTSLNEQLESSYRRVIDSHRAQRF